jgi:Na+-driven multidrug efflux pump
MMIAQSSTGFVEAWFLSKLGIDALAGAALVLPILILMQSMSQGAMGGGISSAVARALGAGQHAQANSLALHALILNTVLGIICSALLIIFSTPLFELMGAKDESLVAALAYANIAFPGLILMWIMNALASVIRGSGNMFTPGIVISGGAVLLVPISPLLIFGWGPFPALGIAGAGWALVVYYASGTAIMFWYVLSGRNLARLQKGPLSWPPMRNILAVGGLATLNPLGQLLVLKIRIIICAEEPSVAPTLHARLLLLLFYVPLLLSSFSRHYHVLQAAPLSRPLILPIKFLILSL